MGVPRETLRLVRVDGDTRMITTRTGVDHTDSMRAWAEKRTKALAGMELRGYVLKKDSPSCGMERVKVYGDGGGARVGIGTYAEVLKARFSSLPIEEEGRLTDPVLRENFIERVFAYDRLRALFGGRMDAIVARRLPHSAQNGAAGPFDYGVSGARAAGRGRDQDLPTGPAAAV